ncbi:MAG: hypothetical protein ACOYXT_17995 [Bacteroidota bacterium]
MDGGIQPERNDLWPAIQGGQLPKAVGDTLPRAGWYIHRDSGCSMNYNAHITRNTANITRNSACFIDYNALITRDNGCIIDDNACFINDNARFTRDNGCITDDNACFINDNACFTRDNAYITDDNAHLINNNGGFMNKDGNNTRKLVNKQKSTAVTATTIARGAV